MSSLVRTAVGEFRIEDTCELEELTDTSIQAHLQPAIRAVDRLPSVELTDNEAERIRNGMVIENRSNPANGEVVARDASGKLLAILAPHGPGHLRPLRNFQVD